MIIICQNKACLLIFCEPQLVSNQYDYLLQFVCVLHFRCLTWSQGRPVKKERTRNTFVLNHSRILSSDSSLWPHRALQHIRTKNCKVIGGWIRITKHLCKISLFVKVTLSLKSRASRKFTEAVEWADMKYRIRARKICTLCWGFQNKPKKLWWY